MIKKITWIDTDQIYGGVTLKDLTRPEQNNMALHVCLDPDQVRINRQDLADELNISLSSWCLPWQKHTNKMAKITVNEKGRGAYDKESSIMDVDCVYTTEEGILIGVFTADCLGILVIDDSHPFLGAIHSGWKGTAQQITSRCIHSWIQQGLIEPKHTQVYFSPSILFDSLEVGMEVVDQLSSLPFDLSSFIHLKENGKAMIDNQGINIQMLINEGIPFENIHPSHLDTKKEAENCFSYRNDKKTGEHFTFGYIKPKNKDDRSS